MKKIFLLAIAFGFSSTSFSQSLLNKLKNKVEQEATKLENKSSSNSTSSQPVKNKNKLSSNVTRTVAASLSNDEIFDYSENCINLGETSISFIVTNRRNHSCYLYKDGSKTPVTCPTILQNNCNTMPQCSYNKLRAIEQLSDEWKQYVFNQTQVHHIPSSQTTVSDQQMKMMAAYLTPEQLEEVKKKQAAAQTQAANQSYTTVTSSTIHFNGKNYGPYKNVSAIYLTPDSKNFYAIVGDSISGSHQVQNKIITSTSNTVLTLNANSYTTSLFVSPDNSEFGYVGLDAANQKQVVVTSSGKKYEMAIGTSNVSEAWYSAIGNHVVYIIGQAAGNQLLVDGKLVKTFAMNEYTEPCNIYVSADGNSATTIKNNILSFGDGDYFEYPLKINVVNINGKPYYKWLAYENNEVVVYQKPY